MAIIGVTHHPTMGNMALLGHLRPKQESKEGGGEITVEEIIIETGVTGGRRQCHPMTHGIMKMRRMGWGTALANRGTMRMMRFPPLLPATNLPLPPPFVNPTTIIGPGGQIRSRVIKAIKRTVPVMFEALVISSRTNNTRGAIAIRIISGKSLNSTVEKTKLSPH
jgi:hypothetical protein